MLGGSIRRHPQELKKQPISIKLPLESASTRPGYPTSSFGRNLLTSGTVFVHGLGVLVTLRSPGLRERNKARFLTEGRRLRWSPAASRPAAGRLAALFRVLAVRSDISRMLGRPGFRLIFEGPVRRRKGGGPLGAIRSHGGHTPPYDLKRTEEQEQPLLLRWTQLFETIFHLCRLAFVPLNGVLEAQGL